MSGRSGCGLRGRGRGPNDQQDAAPGEVVGSSHDTHTTPRRHTVHCTGRLHHAPPGDVYTVHGAGDLHAIAIDLISADGSCDPGP